MDIVNLGKALFLGIVEGGTEFIPVSSTGHLILIGHFLGFHSTGKTFEVLIQLGAILAIMLVYFTRLLGVVLCLPTDAWARRFVVSVLVAFLPAAMLGALLMGTTKRAAAEFSFFLAMPTMAGAFAYDLYKNHKLLDFSDVGIISVGFVAAFISGLFVVRFLLDYVSRHGFTLFAVWRIVVGTAGLAGLYLIR